MELDTGHWTLDTGHWTLDTGHWTLELDTGTGHWTLYTGPLWTGTGTDWTGPGLDLFLSYLLRMSRGIRVKKARFLSNSACDHCLRESGPSLR
jgi:hypothetical protein